MKAAQLILVSLLALGMLLMLGASAQAKSGDGLITVGDPTKDGKIDITILCHRTNNTTETIKVSVQILATDDATGKATKIDNAIDALSPDCFSSDRTTNKINLTAGAGNKIVNVSITVDETAETIGVKVSTSEPARNTGGASFRGTPAGGTATASLAVGAKSASTGTNGKTATQIMQALVTSLTGQGVGAELAGNEVKITDNLTDVDLSAGNTDTGLTLALGVTQASVGGIAEYPDAAQGASAGWATDSSGWAAGTYAALAGGLAAAMVVVAAGAWYGRRRFVR